MLSLGRQGNVTECPVTSRRFSVTLLVAFQSLEISRSRLDSTSGSRLDSTTVSFSVYAAFCETLRGWPVFSAYENYFKEMLRFLFDTLIYFRALF